MLARVTVAWRRPESRLCDYGARGGRTDHRDARHRPMERTRISARLEMRRPPSQTAIYDPSWTSDGPFLRQQSCRSAVHCGVARLRRAGSLKAPSKFLSQNQEGIVDDFDSPHFGHPGCLVQQNSAGSQPARLCGERRREPIFESAPPPDRSRVPACGRRGARRWSKPPSKDARSDLVVGACCELLRRVAGCQFSSARESSGC